jgi:DNA repair ATPase RecN
MKQVLKRLDETIFVLKQKTQKINDFLVDYDVENSNPDDLINMISIRKDLIDQIQAHHDQFIELEKSLTNISSDRELIELKNSIVEKLTDIIEKYRIDLARISDYQQIVSKKLSEVKKGRKMTHAYNVFPHRKAIFVDVASRSLE